MSKHLLYSDMHMRIETLDICVTVHRAIGKAAVKHGVVKSGGYVLNNGDLFNLRGMIHTRCWDVLLAERLLWLEQGIRHIDNIGNHDQEDRDGEVHPLKIYEQFKDWIVCSKPTHLADLDWVIVPYTRNLEPVLAEVKAVKPKVLFVHAGIRTAWRNDKSQDTDGIDIKLFKPFSRVFTGHYHYRHEVGNVQYLGSTYQVSHAEAGQAKGYWIYDDETDEAKFYEITGTPKHYDVVVEVKKGKLVALSREEEFDFNEYDKVRCKLIGAADDVRMVKRERIVEAVGHNNITIKRDISDKATSRLALNDKALDTDELVKKYVEFIEPELDQARLVKMGREFLANV